MKIVKTNRRGIDLAVKYLRAGRSVVYPTDTAYGLGVDVKNLKAIKKLLKIKERKNQPVHIVVSSLAMAKKYTRFDKAAEKLFRKLLPGPLTLVLSRKLRRYVASKGRGKSIEILSAGTGTIGIRMPDNKVALGLVKKLGRPITTPSANPHGRPTPYSIQDSLRQFRNKKYQPDLYLDAGKLLRRKPSTLVKIESGRIKILRKGPISKKQILKITNN